MHTNNYKPVGRFNLLLLEEGEYYFGDYSAHYYPSGVEDYLQPRRKQKGRLNLCSNSLIFDPEEERSPIIKFPYKHVEFIRQYNGPLLKHLPNTEIFTIKSKITVRMKENNVDGPYVFKEETEEFRFSLIYESLASFLPKALNLYAVSQQNPSFAEAELKRMIDERESSISFDTSAIVDLNEKILKETTAIWVMPLVNNPGKLVVTDQYIYFQPFNHLSVNRVEKIQLENIVRISRRRYVLRPIGLEIFLNNGDSAFFAFKSTEIREKICEVILGQPHVINLKMEEQNNMTLKWQNGVVSNFDYLMYLNNLAGRTYNDLTQYPVFPWVLTDYSSKEINLNDPSYYRDLKKPIGALNPERLSMFVNRMQQMPEPKFLYGTHYSTPGYVLFYLVREVPEYMLRLQNGKFDHPSRLFHSIGETWTGVLNNPADVKELIPEFYDTTRKGSFLSNFKRLNFGVKDVNTLVDDVVLPPWANGPEDFVNKMRDALESDIVSDQLNHWIDLIFGHKQQGPESIEANNVFYHLTYEGAVDLDKITDPIEKASIVAQIKEFGQTPKQLFTTPHPQRLPKHLRSSEVTTLNIHNLELSEIFIPLSAEPLDTVLKLDTWGSMEDLALDFSYKLHKDNITSIRLSTDGKVFSASQDSSLKIYSIVEKKQIRSANPCDMSLSSLELNADEKIVMLGCWDNTIYIYSVETGRVLEAITAHDDAVSCLCLRGDILISGSWDTTVKVWQVLKGTTINRIPLAEFIDHDAEIHCLDMDSHAHTAVSGSAGGTLVIYDISTRTQTRTLQLHGDAINCVQFTPDGNRVVSCSNDGTVKLTETTTGTEIFSTSIRETIIKCLITDGTTLLMGGVDGILRVWTLKSGAELKKIKGSNEPIQCLACTPDGKTVVAGSSNSIRVYKSNKM